jgi:SSS family transporter
MAEALAKLGTLNALVVAAYLVGILGIGYWASRRVRSSRGYFIADGKMNFVVVGLSILGTYLSALTMMGLPAMSFGSHQWTWTVQLPFLLVTAFVITRFVLPRYRDAGVISVYEYLEQRIHVSSRCLASLSFVLFSVARMGLVLYLPALALHAVTGVDLPATILVMGVVITVYTVLGGIEAVVWTDAVQVVIFTVGALLTVVFIFLKLGDADFMAIATANHKFRVVVPGLDCTKIVTVWLVLQTIFETIRIYGTQQDITQRYATTPSTRKANLSVWVAILGYIPLGYLFYFIGTALFVFYYVTPDPAISKLKNDAVYAHFIVTQLPPGVAGLLLAGVIAAAMSSIDSLMNSASTVCIEDFYKRFSKTSRPDAHYLLVARMLTVLWGALAIGMAFLFIGIRYAQWAWTKVMAISTNGVLGLMALAFLPFRVNRWAAVAGFVACYASLAAMAFLTRVNALLWPVVGNLVCFFVALLVHWLIGRLAGGDRHA